MKHLADNLMTWATILIAVAAAAGSAAGAIPGDAGMELAKWSIIAGAAGRALVMAAKQLGTPPDIDQGAVFDAVNAAAQSHLAGATAKLSAQADEYFAALPRGDAGA